MITRILLDERWGEKINKHTDFFFFTCCDAIEDHGGEDDDNRSVDELVSGANNSDTEKGMSVWS